MKLCTLKPTIHPTICSRASLYSTIIRASPTHTAPWLWQSKCLYSHPNPDLISPTTSEKSHYASCLVFTDHFNHNVPLLTTSIDGINNTYIALGPDPGILLLYYTGTDEVRVLCTNPIPSYPILSGEHIHLIIAHNVLQLSNSNRTSALTDLHSFQVYTQLFIFNCIHTYINTYMSRSSKECFSINYVAPLLWPNLAPDSSLGKEYGQGWESNLRLVL